MNNFIQAADFHIGECRSFDGYLERHEKALYEVLTHASKETPLIVAGDIFHRNDTKHEERIIFKKWLLEIEKRQIKTIIIFGNHDHIAGTSTQIDLFVDLPFSNITIVTNPAIVTINNIDFICLPWQDYTSETLKADVERLIMACNSQFKVAVLHECICGSISSNGTIMNSKLKIPNLPQIDYWAVGDIHEMQPTNVTNGWYSGSLMQFKFDDGLQKGILKVSLPFTTQPEFIPIRSKKMKVISSASEMDDDSYYFIKGSVEDVIEGNSDARVVRTEWVKKVETTIDYERIGITDGLAEFLALRGLDEALQKESITWVAEILKVA